MIAHALTIVVNELNHHLVQTYGESGHHAPAGLRNLASAYFPSKTGPESASHESINLTLVNLEQDNGSRNLPASRDQADHSPQPLHLNLLVLVTATHASYDYALLMLGRTMQFFHAQSVFTHHLVNQESISRFAPLQPRDRLREFKFSIDLHSPSLEESHQIWTVLKSPHFPFALYKLRLLDTVTDATEIREVSMLERKPPSSSITANDGNR
jgi:hypothetical protein